MKGFGFRPLPAAIMSIFRSDATERSAAATSSRDPGSAPSRRHNAPGDDALEIAISERVILDLDREALIRGIERRTLGDGPGAEHAADLQAKIVVQRGCGMFPNDEAAARAGGDGFRAVGFGGTGQVPSVPVFPELVSCQCPLRQIDVNTRPLRGNGPVSRRFRASPGREFAMIAHGCEAHGREEEEIMSNTYAISEIVGTSEKSLDDAIRSGIATASKSLRHLDWFEVSDIRGHLSNGQVAHYQVTMRLGFRYEQGGS
jgi:flavin-binding protein dodecin